MLPPAIPDFISVGEASTRGYHAEKLRLEDEIEESFARIPTDDHASAGYGDAA